MRKLSLTGRYGHHHSQHAWLYRVLLIAAAQPVNERFVDGVLQGMLKLIAASLACLQFVCSYPTLVAYHCPSAVLLA